MAAPRPLRVLLTGGPGGGKTSALAKLRDRLTRRGFQAILVPETSTTLLSNSGGYDVAWSGTPRHVDLQEIFMKFQTHQEDTFINIAGLRPDKAAVVLCDRGLLEGKLFCSDEEWAESLRRLKTTEEDLLGRYDLVLHMKSIASGMAHLYEFGPGSSNPSRYHTPEQARECDQKAQDLYAAHPQVRIVDNFPDFDTKIETALNYVFEVLKSTGSGAIGQWEREFVPARFPLEDKWPVDYDVYETKITFLDKHFAESIRTRELVTSEGFGRQCIDPEFDFRKIQCEYRKEIKQGDRSCITRQVLTPENFNLLRESCNVVAEVKKRSTCFVYDGHHYELSSYSGTDAQPLSEDWGIHGHKVLDRPVGAIVPPFLVADSFGDAGENVTNERPAKKSRVLARHATTSAAVSALEKKDTKAPAPVQQCLSPLRLHRGPEDLKSPQCGRSPMSKLVAAAVLEGSGKDADK